MKLNVLNLFTVEIGSPQQGGPAPERHFCKQITRDEIDAAIVALYDEFVKEHGPTTKSVFFIATQKQVSARLEVNPSSVAQAVKDVARRGFAEYKKEVLVRAGRGHFWHSEHFRHFMPKHDFPDCWSDDESWHNQHHIEQTVHHETVQ